MKPANKFVICAVIAIVGITCGYLIYYTWSITFGVIDSSKFVIEEDKTVPSRSSDDDEWVTTKTVPISKHSPQFNMENDENEINLNLHKNFHLFNHVNCGKFKNGINDRVVNGNPANFLANPWIVALKYKHPTRESRIMCAGTLISEKFIITAGHCLETGKYMLSSIILGDYDLSSEVDCQINSSGVEICADPVQEITSENFEFGVHRKFSKRVRAYFDIGLIKLKVPANLKQNNINTICLPFFEEDIPEQLVVIGWGKTENSSKSDILLQAGLPLVENGKCFRDMQEMNSIRGVGTLELNESQFCAGGKNNKDSCQGDSGGPIQAISFKNHKFIQYGIVSYGLNDCGTAPGVYTKVSSYLKWILDNA